MSDHTPPADLASGRSSVPISFPLQPMALPPGKKPLREVEQQSNAANRVIDLAILLDFALATLDPAPAPGQVSLSERIKRHAARFGSIPDLLFAVGVRNDLVHATSSRKTPPKEPEIKRAAKHLRHGLLEIVPHIDPVLAREILAGSHADPERSATPRQDSESVAKRKRRLAPALETNAEAQPPVSRAALWRGGALVILILIVVPPLLKRWLYGSESAAEGSRITARSLAERYADVPEVVRSDPAFEAARAAMSSGDHWWSRLDYSAAAQRYDEAVRRFEQVGIRLENHGAAVEAKTRAELARDRAIANRVAQEDPAGWAAALDTLAAANKLLEGGAEDYGATAFARAAGEFEASSEAARIHREERLVRTRADARAAFERGAIAEALDTYFSTVLEGDAEGRTRFDEIATGHPEYFEQIVARRLESASADFPDRLRACIALAKRNATRPQSLSPKPLLSIAFQDALRVADPENAADFLIEIARARLEFGSKDEISTTLRAAADPLAVIRTPSNAILRYAQLAALALRAADSPQQDEFMRLARQPTLTQSELSRLPQAIFRADSGDIAGAFAEADHLLERAEDREFAQLAFAWIALRAAEATDVESHRRAVLAISSLADRSGPTGFDSPPIDGSQARGAIALVKLVEADLELGRPADADRWRIAIRFPPLRAAADYALAEALARGDDLVRARALFDPIDHSRSTFGAAAAAEIAAAMIRKQPREPSNAYEWALGLTTPDLVLSALGAIAQEMLRTP